MHDVNDAAAQLTQPAADSDIADALDDTTKQALYEKAKQAEVPGRSTMTKDELREALDE